MKKILIVSIIILSIFLIYLCNIDKKIYYLALGDSVAKGQGSNYGYTDYIKYYLEEKEILEKYVDVFANDGYRTTDLINDIKNNKKKTINKKEITLQHALVKADLTTISIGANDIISKINVEEPIDYDAIYDYIDNLSLDLDKLLKLIREYCKEDIIIIGYYNPYYHLNSENTDKVFNYLNKKYSKVCSKYDINYVKIDTLFKNKSEDYLNGIHPNEYGYKAISKQVIKVINKTLFNVKD